MKKIEVGENTKQVHGIYISWLNGLLNQYVSSFYDTAIQNILTVAFIKRHKSFIQELYADDGKLLTGFMTVLPTDSTNYILMIHDLNGKPYMYNKTNGSDLFNFNASGVLTNFFEDVTIPLYNENGTNTHECFITFKDRYGIKVPFYVVKIFGTNTTIMEGFVDFNYEGRYSGTYLVDTAPMDKVSYFVVKSNSVSTLVLDIPILKGFEIQYQLRPGQTVDIPFTETVEYFLRQMEDLGTVSYTLVNI